ncbi:MAG: DoxX family protein [Bacteroidota bacterium]|uniref:DoxX family protein n=1 Tax=Flagellimonas profundi TaxID=2915620 RepID=A0ABS3FA63_9FLAO|nr:DoxX family protein [Allomuricauda profundi]MBO0340041.1 DoxX family protein [Allomuricauda profundi]MEC7772734.1 DoxX family protein [Bacteroidota bacterium]
MGKSIKERMLSISMGVVYFWFGALKFVPNLSPAEDLAKNTIHHLTFGLIPDEVSIILLAIWEVGLGFLFVLGLFRRQAVILALIHMVCTFTPLLFFPNDVFGEEPLSLTLVGQYIMKNLIIIAVLISIYESKTAPTGQEVPSENKKESFPYRFIIGKNLFKKA